ncbi:hypothetical protein LWI28_014429 [Acer negundo]|uniref:Uncharacterized protein n=1 Tax=Acer negundo TaxID=4023 RepID=A0AAD5JT89_ACENE|nr:hypothetical protein LWI28_014429 [Acer negundo]
MKCNFSRLSLSLFNDERLLHCELHDHHNHRDFVLEEPKKKAAYSSWCEKTFFKRSINVVPFLRRAALIEEEYEGAGQ